MGFFSSKKTTYVSSVVYNLAGPVEDRPDYLKSVILGNMITQGRFKPAKVIQSAYVSGAGLRLRTYHRWCRTNFRQIGIPGDRFLGKPEYNAEEVATILQSEYGITAYIDWIDSGPADVTMWGRQWMREHLPEKEPLDVWKVDYIEETNEVLITFTDGTTAVHFEPSGYRDRGDYLYVAYSRPTQTNRWTTPLLFIYRRGSGSAALDGLFLAAQATGEYLPFIPVRHENKFISDTYKPAVYAEAKKAYKKAVGQKFDELIDKISENESLGDIDFAYVFFGVPMNTKDMSSRRYLFDYFKHLQNNQLVSGSAYTTWIDGLPTQDIAEWQNWYADQLVNSAGSVRDGVMPGRPSLSGMPSNSVIIEDRGPGQTNLKMEITWSSMMLTGGLGLAKTDAKKGEVWFTFAGSETINPIAYTDDEIEDLTVDTVELYHQITAGTWEKITIKGMVHRNHIYDGKFVEITAAQSLLDADESGFLVPVHYGVFRAMSLIDATQMATQCVQIVFNCYQVVKQKWYQTTWFKILLVIVIIVITVMTGGVTAGGFGLLGTNAGVGMALGFSGLAATIAGVVANMVAAMILTKLITYVSVAVLGEKIGLIVAAIASLVALQVGTALQSGQSMASIWSSLAEPMSLLNMTNSVGNAYSSLVNMNTMSYMEKTKDVMDDYRKQSLELQQNYAENIGYGTAAFDPMALIGGQQEFFTEPSEVFLSRTLLTGSEIAQMSQDLITDFTELSLRNEFFED